MQTLINGSPGSQISIMDRGFLYGDGVFETLAVSKGRPILLKQHLDRLASACLTLKLAFDKRLIRNDLQQLIQNSTDQSVAKIIVTRGAGGRGYKPGQNTDVTRIVQLFDLPLSSNNDPEAGVRVRLCQHRLSQSATLAGMKHLNRLDQVIASTELGSDDFEGLCLDQEDRVIEGTKSNLILFKDGEVLTPDLSLSGVRGIMLTELLRLFEREGFSVQSRHLSLEDVNNADEVILCNSVFGVRPVIKFIENGNVTHWMRGKFFQRAAQFKDEIFTPV